MYTSQSETDSVRGDSPQYCSYVVLYATASSWTQPGLQYAVLAGAGRPEARGWRRAQGMEEGVPAADAGSQSGWPALGASPSWGALVSRRWLLLRATRKAPDRLSEVVNEKLDGCNCSIMMTHTPCNMQANNECGLSTFGRVALRLGAAMECCSASLCAA